MTNKRIQALFAFLICILTCGTPVFAQNTGGANLLGQRNVITTAVPFLTITPDARSGAMGDAGVAISPDANSMFWNPAKLAFVENDFALSLAYTPWLRALGIPDINISYLAGYKRIDPLSTAGFSMKYFSLGDIQFTDNQGNPLRTYRPYELAIDGGYARKLSSLFSMAISGRFIYSGLAGDLTLNGSSVRPGIGVAADLSAYYQKDITIREKASRLSFGGNISNIGNKITYTTTSQRDFIPLNLRLGGAVRTDFNEFNRLVATIDFNKLLVPTPAVRSSTYDSACACFPVIAGTDRSSASVISGALGSFTDAPGGFKEELREINPSIGLEYWYNKQFAARAGYFYEHPTKGNRQFATVGIGVRYNVLGFDFSYLIATNSQRTINRSPLENTLRFSLMFNLGKKNSTGRETPSTN